MITIDQNKIAAMQAATRAAKTMPTHALWTGLAAEGWVTDAEFDAWLENRLPVWLTTAIARLPVQKRGPIKAQLLKSHQIGRMSEGVLLIAAEKGKTDAQLDALFETYKDA